MRRAKRVWRACRFRWRRSPAGGNHGIANFLGVWGYAQAVGADRERTARALAIASLVTIAIKAHTGKLTAFCGCAIAPATGLAAAAAYLMGGDAATQALSLIHI